MRNRKRLYLIVGAALVAAGIAMWGCSALGKQETTASNLPSAATLKAACSAGFLQTPPIRAGACDDFNIAQTGCISLGAQPLVPAQALLPCQMGGYVTSGGWTQL